MFKLIPAVAAVSAIMATSAFAQQQTTPSAEPPAVTAPDATAPDATSPSTTAPAPSTSATTDSTGMNSAPVMTEAEANAWINKTVYSSDGKNLGEVSQILRDSSGKVSELHADIGGFLGIGETRVRLMPNDFKLASDRVILNIPGDQAKTLPKIEKQ